MRWTKAPRTALERLLQRWPDVAPEKRHSPKKALAFALQLLQVRHVQRAEVQEAIRFSGYPPMGGMSGWMAAAMEWGRSDPPRVRRAMTLERELTRVVRRRRSR